LGDIDQAKLDKDSMFLSAVFLLADEWGVTIKDIDMENRILDFDCKWDLRHPFAMKLNDMFGDYLE
jgi:hypothetical protein